MSFGTDDLSVVPVAILRPLLGATVTETTAKMTTSLQHRAQTQNITDKNCYKMTSPYETSLQILNKL